MTNRGARRLPPVQKKVPAPPPTPKPKPKKQAVKGRKPARQSTILVPQKDGTVNAFTQKNLQDIRRQGKPPAENYVRLSKPNIINFDNDPLTGIRANWEAIAEAVIMAAAAANPTLAPPVGSAGLKFYLWHAAFTRWRAMECLKPGSAGSISVYSTNSIPDFVCEQHIPVAFAKFLHSTMPYTDPTTKARYEWTQTWTQMFDNYVPTTLPAFSGPCINTQASASNDVWNRSVFGNSILRQASTINVGNNNEMYWGLNPNSETLTVDTVYQQASAISTYFQTVGNCIRLSKIPKVAYDGTFYSFVNSAQSLFPGIFSSTSYVDVEFSYVFHLPINPNAGVSQQQQSFAYNTEIPSVLNEIAPTALGGLLAPAQAQMVLNYAYILRACPWHVGGRRELLKGMHKVYPGLRSVKPNYSSLDLNKYHQMVEDCLYTVLDNYANRANTAGDARTLSDISALLTVFECALFARVASFFLAFFCFVYDW